MPDKLQEDFMALINISNLSGIALDWAVDYTLTLKPLSVETVDDELVFKRGDKVTPLLTMSDNWGNAGPILQKRDIYPSLSGWDDDHYKYLARLPVFKMTFDGETRCESYGETPLLACLRCLVSSQFGNKIEVPDVLLLDN